MLYLQYFEYINNAVMFYYTKHYCKNYYDKYYFILNRIWYNIYQDAHLKCIRLFLLVFRILFLYYYKIILKIIKKKMT